MRQLEEIEMLKEIPGYKTALKAVLKSQIQYLAEQLSQETDEETIILSASTSNGKLSRLGSLYGKDFLQFNQDIQLKFAQYCLHKSSFAVARKEKEQTTDFFQSEQLHGGDRSLPLPYLSDQFHGGDRSVPLPYLIDKASESLLKGVCSNASDTPNKDQEDLSQALHTVAQSSEFSKGKRRQTLGSTPELNKKSVGVKPQVDADTDVDESSGEPCFDVEMENTNTFQNYTDNMGEDSEIRSETISAEMSDTKYEPDQENDNDESNNESGNVATDAEVKFEFESEDSIGQSGGFVADDSSADNEHSDPTIKVSEVEKVMLEDFAKSSKGSGQRHYCAVCQKSYSQKGRLAFHYKNMHSKEPLPGATCQICQRIFSSVVSRKRHELVKHYGIKRFQCEQCDRSFGTSYALANHVRGHHCDEESKITCTICGATFRYKSSLREHQKRCGNPEAFTNYGCMECLSTFTSTRALQCHVQSKHGDLTFICEECGAKFSYRASYKRHMLTKHSCK